MNEDELKSILIKESMIQGDQAEVSYTNIIQSMQHTIVDNVVDIITNIIGFQNRGRLENIVEENLIHRLLIEGRHRIKKIDEDLTVGINFIYNKALNPDTENINYIIEDVLDRVENDQDYSWIEEISYEFLQQLTRSFSYYLDNEFGSSYMENALEDIKYNVKQYVESSLESIIKEYKSDIRYNLNNFKNKTIDNINEYRRNNTVQIPLAIEDVSGYKIIFGLAGFHAEDTFEGLMLVDNQTSQKYPIHKDSKGNIVTSDKNISFNYQNGEHVYINNTTQKIISTDGVNITLGTFERPTKYRMMSGFDEYDIFYGKQKLTEVNQLCYFEEDMRKNFPTAYAKLSEERSFATKLNDAIKEDERLDEIKVDEQGISHIVPENKERYLEKLSVFGLTAIEHEDGIYIIDKSNNEEHKLDYHGYSLIEGIKGACFYTRYGIILKNSMSKELMKYKTSNFDFICEEDLSRMHIFVNNIGYHIEIDKSGKLSFRVHGIGDYNFEITDPIQAEKAVKEAFRDSLPSALEAFNNKHFPPEHKTNDINELMEELDNTSTLKEPVSMPELKNDNLDNAPSLDEQIFALEQNPAVQQYIALLAKQKEAQALSGEVLSGNILT